jgi:hypothetical protein
MSQVNDDFELGSESDDEPMVNNYYLYSYLAPLLIKLALIKYWC